MSVKAKDKYIVLFSLLFVSLLLRTSNALADTLLEKIESPYNTIFVYDEAPYITLAFGYKRRRYIESRRNPDDLTELPVEYTKSFTLALAYPKNLKSFLMIGMGGGSTSWYLHKSLPEAKVTAVELDGEIISLADKYYKVRKQKNFKISEMDGRVHILRNQQRHDIIFIDAYRGPFVPFHLMTKEFFALAKKRLTKGGVIVQNIEPSTMLFDRAIATMNSVFENTDLYKAGGNIVAIGYDGPKIKKTELLSKATNRQATFNFRYPLPDLIKERSTSLEVDKSSAPLTDDFAPVNMLKEIKTHNRKRSEREAKK